MTSAAFEGPAAAAVAPSSPGAQAVRDLLRAVKLDPDSASLEATPGRVAKFAGQFYAPADPAPSIDPSALMPALDCDLIAIELLPFHSICEHHLLPFLGTVTLVYRPAASIVGIGHVQRLVESFAQRLQIQERLTAQIADTFHTGVAPASTFVISSAQHSCMWARGEGDARTSVTVTASRGAGAAGTVHAEALALLSVSRAAPGHARSS